MKHRDVFKSAQALMASSTFDADLYAIDPLANFYLDTYKDLIPTKIDYRVGVGEDLPWEDEFFDIILMHNCLDHTSSPSTALKESFRTLKNNGILYIGVHIFSLLGYLITKPRTNILWMVDPAHPQVFTWRFLLRNLLNSNFRVISYEIPFNYIQKRKNLPYPISKFYSKIA